MTKGINNITYKHLNQPVVIVQDDKRTEYHYSASGGMLKAETYVNDVLETQTKS